MWVNSLHTGFRPKLGFQSEDQLLLRQEGLLSILLQRMASVVVFGRINKPYWPLALGRLCLCSSRSRNLGAETAREGGAREGGGTYIL